MVPFYNEHLSALLRTCYSILNRSPEELIVEIILVDDYSTKKFLKSELEEYVAKHLPKVKVIRLKERSGLILARMAGAKIAKGEVLIFLDAHTEANVNWLPPLLGKNDHFLKMLSVADLAFNKWEGRGVHSTIFLASTHKTTKKQNI